LGYDAFISYSHAADAQLAPRLQDGLQRLAKPWWRRHALNVFRDSTGLSANPGLWTSITSAMDDAEWFVFLASPEATDSPWVDKELRHWLEHRSVDRLLPVVTDGEWVWDPATGGFDLAASTAVPAALVHAFREEPRHVDLRWARSEEQLDLRHARFRDQVAEIAAPLHGLAKDELEGEDVRQHRRTKRWAAAAVIALLLLTTASVFASVLAVSNSRAAEAAQAEAEDNAREADQNADEAERSAQDAQEAEDLAVRRGEETALERDRATDNERRARQSEAAAAAGQLAATVEAERADAQTRLATQSAEEAEVNADKAQANAAEASQNARRAERNALESLQNAARAERNAAQATASEQQARLAEQQARSSEAAAVTAARRAEAAAAAEAVATQSALSSAELARTETARAEQALSAELAARADLTTRAMASSSLAQAAVNGPLSLLLAARSLGGPSAPPANARVAATTFADAASPTNASPTSALPTNAVGRRALTERVLSLQGGVASHPLERFLTVPADSDPLGYSSEIAVSQDSGRVATVDSNSGRLIVWDLDDPTFVRTFPVPVSAVVYLEFAAGGELLVTGEMGVGIDSATGSVWEVESGELLFARSGGGGVAVSPDGRSIAALSGFPTGTLEFYDPAARQFTATYGDVTASGFVWDWFSADGRWFEGTVDGAAVLWDLRDGGRTQVQLATPVGASCTPVVSPDGARAVTLFPMGPSVGVFSLPDLQLIRTVTLPADFSLASFAGWSPDGRRVAGVSFDGVVVVVDVTTGDVVRAEVPDEPILRLEFTPDGRFVHLGTEFGSTLVSVGDGTVTRLGKKLLATSGGVEPLVFLERSDATLEVRELGTGVTRIAESTDAEIVNSATSPDGQRFAVATTDGRLRVWDLRDGSGPVAGAPAPRVAGLTFTPDGRRLLGAGFDIAVWNLERVGAARRLGSLGTASVRLVSPDGRTVFESPDGVGIVSRDLASDAVTPLVVLPDDVRASGLLVSPDGATLAVTRSDAATTIVDVATSIVRGTIDRKVVAFSGDGSRMVTELAQEFPFPFLEPGFDEAPPSPPPPFDAPGGDDPSPDADDPVEDGPHDDGGLPGEPDDDGGPPPRFDEAGDLEITDARTLETAWTLDATGLPPSMGFAGTVALDRTGQRVAVLGGEGSLSAFDAATGARLWRATISRSEFSGLPSFSLTFSPDGSRLAVRTNATTIRLFDAVTGERLATQTLVLRALSSVPVGELAWSADGTLLAFDGLYLMDGATLEMIGDLRLPTSFLVARNGFVRFTTDGALLTASADGTDVLRIELAPATLAAAACDTAGRNLTQEEWSQYVGPPPMTAICPQYPGP
jgi:WD40 repeat protein